MRKLIFTSLLLLLAGCVPYPPPPDIQVKDPPAPRSAPWENLGWDHVSGSAFNTSRLETPNGWIYRIKQDHSPANFIIIYKEAPTGVVQ